MAIDSNPNSQSSQINLMFYKCYYLINKIYITKNINFLYFIDYIKYDSSRQHYKKNSFLTH